MNVYDFDNTLYRGDSTVDFYLYCLRRWPGLLRYAPGQALAALRYLCHRIDKTAFKQRFFRFLEGVGPEAVETFWQTRIGRVAPWYQKRPDDLVISASPLFLVAHACRLLGIAEPIASPVDPRTGRYAGRNCDGAEKARRFRERYPQATVERFYSDSLSDAPMAALAREAFLVKGGAPRPWP